MARPGRGRLYTIQVKDDGRSKSAIEFHNQFIRAAGIIPSSAKTEIVLTADERVIRQDCLCYFMERCPLPEA